MLCHQVRQVWIHYKVSHLSTCLSTAYILLNLTKVQEVIAAERTALALEMVVERAEPKVHFVVVHCKEIHAVSPT